MLNSLSSNKSVVALFVATFFSIIIYFNKDFIFIKNTQKSWLSLKSIIIKPKLQLEHFIDYKKDAARLNLDRWILETRIKNLNNHDFSSIDLKSILRIDESNNIKIINPSNKSITSSNNLFYTANVLYHNSPQLSSSLFIDIGKENFSLEYKKKNFIAIDTHGNLVGKIVNISDNSSMVQLINDINNRVIIQKKDIPNSTSLLVPISSKKCNLIGNNNYKMSIGDTLYTSYKSKVYIKDIPVCKVIDIINDSDGKGFKKVIVEVLANLNHMEYIFIVETDAESY